MTFIEKIVLARSYVAQAIFGVRREGIWMECNTRAVGGGGGRLTRKGAQAYDSQEPPAAPDHRLPGKPIAGRAELQGVDLVLASHCGDALKAGELLNSSDEDRGVRADEILDGLIDARGVESVKEGDGTLGNDGLTLRIGQEDLFESKSHLG